MYAPLVLGNARGHYVKEGLKRRLALVIPQSRDRSYNNLDHHAAIAAAAAAIRSGKTGCTSGINKLRDTRTTQTVKE